MTYIINVAIKLKLVPGLVRIIINSQRQTIKQYNMEQTLSYKHSVTLIVVKSSVSELIVKVHVQVSLSNHIEG